MCGCDDCDDCGDRRRPAPSLYGAGARLGAYAGLQGDPVVRSLAPAVPRAPLTDDQRRGFWSDLLTVGSVLALIAKLG
jgi:hypothetical protein